MYVYFLLCVHRYYNEYCSQHYGQHCSQYCSQYYGQLYGQDAEGEEEQEMRTVGVAREEQIRLDERRVWLLTCASVLLCLCVAQL